MATDVSATSYLVNKAQVVAVLDSTFSKKFSTISSITSNADNTWTFRGISYVNGNGFSLVNPTVKVTKADVSSFLLSYSTVTINSSTVVDVKFANDATFLEVITT